MIHIYAIRKKGPLHVNAHVGTTINKAATEAIKLSKELDIEVVLHFNGREINCDHRNDNTDDVTYRYLNRE